MSILSACFFGLEIFALILSILLFIVVQWNRNNHFSASFFRLYKIDSIGNLLTWINAVYLLRLSSVVSPTSPLAFLYVGIGEPLPRISQSLSYFFAYVQYNMTLLLALNRWSVMVLNPAKRDKIWMTKKALLTIAGILMVPIGDIFRFFLYETTTTFDEEEKQFLFSSEMSLQDQFKYLLYYMPFCTAIALTTNFLSLWNLHKLRSITSAKNQKRDGHLVWTSMATCVVQSCGCGLSIVRYSGSWESVLVSILPYVSSILTWFQPVMLFLLSQNARKEVKKLVLCRNEISVMVQPANLH